MPNRKLMRATAFCGYLISAWLCAPIGVHGQERPLPVQPSAPTQAQQQPRVVLEAPGFEAAIEKALNAFAADKAASAEAEDRKERREKADLLAQEEQAEWAKWMVIASSVQILAGVITIGLLWCTYRQSKRTDERGLRAYLSMNPTSLQNPDADKFVRINFKTRNHGKTPAFDINHKFSVNIWDVEEFNIGIVLNLVRQINENAAVFPESEITTWFDADFKLTTQNISDIKSGKCRLYITGVTFYRDTYGVNRITNFCVSAGSDFFTDLQNKDAVRTWRYERNHSSAT